MILIKSKDRIRYINTASDSLKKYLERDDFQVDRDYLGYVNYYFDNSNQTWSGYIRDQKLESYDLIYLQTAGMAKDQATLLTNYCRGKNIKIIEGNFSRTSSNSKMIQIMKLLDAKLLIPSTRYLGSWAEGKISFDFPFVAKNILGKGGEGVSLIENQTQLEEIIKDNNPENLIFQEYIPNDFDRRVVVIDGEVIYSCQRVRQDEKEFRNNVKLGAKEVLEDPREEIKQLAIRAAETMGLSVAGVDIVENEGKLYIIEVNRAPSLPVNYDIFKGISALGEYIKRCLK